MIKREIIADQIDRGSAGVGRVLREHIEEFQSVYARTI